LTEPEYDKALGLWKDKQEHIKHLEEEQKKLKDNEKVVKKTLGLGDGSCVGRRFNSNPRSSKSETNSWRNNQG
jgi:hypothetical protein